MHAYLPASQGTEYELTPTLQPLQPFRDYVTVVSGLNSLPAPGRPGGTHAKASTRFLTDMSPPTSETVLDAGISLDQILAQEFGKQTQLGSLELAIESADTTAGACDVPGSRVPIRTRFPGVVRSTPLPMETTIHALCLNGYSGDSGSTDAKTRLERIHQRRSILDSAIEEMRRLESRLSKDG